MTILTSLLGTKAFSFFILMWQQAAASPGEAAPVDHFSFIAMIKSMSAVAIGVVIVLLIMSVYSIAIMVERYLTYTAAKKQSREFAPRVAQALKNDRIEEAINISDKHRKSHLAMVVSSGLQEFRAHEQSSDISGDEIEASKRALQRAIAIKTAEFKRGLSGLATIGSTAPFVGLFGTVFGIIASFGALGADVGSARYVALSRGISQALVNTATGLAIGIPAMAFYAFFRGRAQKLISELESAATHVLALLSLQFDKRTERTPVLLEDEL